MCSSDLPVFDSTQVIACCIHVVVMGGGVNDELNVVRPSMSANRHFNLLAIVMVIGNSAVEHAEPLRRG